MVFLLIVECADRMTFAAVHHFEEQERTNLITLAVSLVLISGLIHSVWNLFAKQSINKTVFLWSIQFIALIVYLPIFIIEIQGVQLDLRGYLFLAGSSLFHAYIFICWQKDIPSEIYHKCTQ